MLHTLITVRVYFNINNDANNEMYKTLFQPQIAHQTSTIKASPSSEEHVIRIEDVEQVYIDVRIMF